MANLEDNFSLKQGMHIHLVGIGGTGISAIAQVLIGRGFVVSGSDAQTNAYTAVLQDKGATIYQGHAAANITGAEAVIISSAIPDTNPEVAAARAANIPVLKRSEFLGPLMADSTGIAVAGSHGKTTTTGMIAHILLEAGTDPTIILGGLLPQWESNGRFGAGEFFVIEADEYDHMFLGLRPTIAVITNIEHDHPDIYPTAAEYMAAFQDFANLLPPNGKLIVCGADPGIQNLLSQLDLTGAGIVTYGIASTEQNFTMQALDIRPNQLGGVDFLVEQNGQTIGLARMRLPGLHNVGNALAAIAVALEAGIPFPQIVKALAGFGGVGRRFQVTGEIGGVTIIDDYAHHPTEIRATLAAARQRYPGRRLWAVWQPHTYSRTKLYFDEFVNSFQDADRVVALDIYRSREKDTLGIDTAVVISAMNHPNAVHIATKEAAAAYLLDRIIPDDVILTLGAGDGNLVGQWVLEGLQDRLHPHKK